MSDTVFHLQKRAKNIKGTPSYQPYSKVRIIVGEDEEGNQLVYEAGNDSARVLEITNPYGTQALANSILQRLSGYQYTPFTADGALINPAAELGDGVSVGDVYSFVASAETTLSPIMSATISAVEDGELNHEYPYETRESKEIARKFNGLRTDFTVELGHVESRIEETYETKTEARNQYSDINQTINGITFSVSQTYQTISNANTQYENLSSSIDLTAKQIKSTVASATSKYYTQGTTIHLYGYGTPDTMGYRASDYIGKTYLDQNTGYTYSSNGQRWAKSASALQLIDTKLESSIVQTSDSIKSTVASSTSKYDLSYLPSGVTIQYYGYGTPAISASGNTNQYYLDQTNGYYYKSNGSSWVRQNSTRLPLITETLSSTITQTANSIQAQVNGIYAPEYDSRKVYKKNDVVKKTNGTTITYYKAIAQNEFSNVSPPNASYWAVVSSPTVQSIANIGLDGITLGYKASDLENSATITLNRNGIEMNSQTITMTNVTADSISANNITGGTMQAGDIAVDGKFTVKRTENNQTINCGWLGGGVARIPDYPNTYADAVALGSTSDIASTYIAVSDGVVQDGVKSGSAMLRNRDAVVYCNASFFQNQSGGGTFTDVHPYCVMETSNGDHYIAVTYNSIRASEQITVVSDRREKTGIDYDMSQYENLFLELKPCSYLRKNKDGKHIGFIAQDVDKSLMLNGIENSALICRRDGMEENPMLSLAYGEFIALNTYMIQKLIERMDSIERKVESMV